LNEGRGSVDRWELARIDVKITLTGAVWRAVLKRTNYGMVEPIWSKSLFLTDSLLLFFQSLQERVKPRGLDLYLYCCENLKSPTQMFNVYAWSYCLTCAK
jgi:hypothetical protein